MSRFVVSSVTGYLIDPDSHGHASGGKYRPTAYFVNDTVFGYRVVGSYVPQNGLTTALCKRRAERQCDQLNAWAATA